MGTTQLHPALAGLEPRELWERFDELRQIPRPSMLEEGVRRHLEAIAETQGWRSARDEAGNLFVYVPGRGVGKKAPPLAVQGHMDMVCTKRAEVQHDFEKDPIQLKRGKIEIEGETREVLQADGTTLGSDNGIGVAAALALALDPGLDHPPLELIFTADEEVGMSGAEHLDSELVHAKRLLNFDAEEHGSFYLSCAGGRDLIARWAVEREEIAADDLPLFLSISGLAGGHSGVDIHRNRTNAILLMAQALSDQCIELDGIRLGRFDGGGQDNAIPRQSEVLLWCARHRAEPLAKSLTDLMARLGREMDPTDHGAFCFEARIGDEAEREALADFAPLSNRMFRTVLKMLCAFPNGVLVMSEAIEGLVESSSNLGILETTHDEMRLVSLTRSSKRGAVEAIQGRMELAMEAAGAQVEFSNAWPGWEADLDNPLVRTAISTYAELFDQAPAIKAIHGGLECGYLAERLPSCNMIAFGPEIVNAHTPDEAVVLDTVGPFYELARRLLRNLCRSERGA